MTVFNGKVKAIETVGSLKKILISPVSPVIEIHVKNKDEMKVGDKVKVIILQASVLTDA